MGLGVPDEHACSRVYLLDTVWGETYVGGDRSVDNTILRLRKKLGSLGEAKEALMKTSEPLHYGLGSVSHETTPGR